MSAFVIDAGVLLKRCALARVGAMVATMVLVPAAGARAQAIEVSPFGGYRFGGDIFESVAGQRLDIDGGPAIGLTLDIPLSLGFHIEALFSHQQADVLVPAGPFGSPARWRITVDHWQGGGLQEFGYERIRPFLTGVVGLTRYRAGADSEIRFTAGAGGGVKLFPLSHIGVRLDGRLFATLLDADGTRLACRPGACLYALSVNLAWQAEFSAALIVKFP